MYEDSECFVKQIMNAIIKNQEITLYRDEFDVMFNQFEIPHDNLLIFPIPEFYFEHEQFTCIPRQNLEKINSLTQICIKPTHNYLYITPYTCHKIVEAEHERMALPGSPDKKKDYIEYSCENKACTKKYVTKNGLKYHKKVGCKIKEKIGSFRCKFQGCKKVYRGASGLNYHLKRAHKK